LKIIQIFDLDINSYMYEFNTRISK
jgi:hypothetical protein